MDCVNGMDQFLLLLLCKNVVKLRFFKEGLFLGSDYEMSAFLAHCCFSFSWKA